MPPIPRIFSASSTPTPSCFPSSHATSVSPLKTSPKNKLSTLGAWSNLGQIKGTFSVKMGLWFPRELGTGGRQAGGMGFGKLGGSGPQKRKTNSNGGSFLCTILSTLHTKTLLILTLTHEIVPREGFWGTG